MLQADQNKEEQKLVPKPDICLIFNKLVDDIKSSQLKTVDAFKIVEQRLEKIELDISKLLANLTKIEKKFQVLFQESTFIN
jgi:hypothetical protein